jgi:hypothetical protein
VIPIVRSSVQGPCIPKVKCRSIGGRAFSVGAPQLWNKLPVSVRNCGDILKFKREQKTFLFAEAFTL